jgi:hypothetical protein
MSEESNENEPENGQISENIDEIDNNNEESENEQIDRYDIIEEKTQQLLDELLSFEKRDKITREIQEQLILLKQDNQLDSEIEHDPEYNTYNFARSASTLSLAGAWPKLKSRMSKLITEIAKTNFNYEKINQLRSVIDKFETNYVDEVNHSKKPNLKKNNEKFESEIFHKVVTDIPQTYADFFDIFIGDVTFTPNGNRLPFTQKFRAYVLDLRNKKQKSDEQGTKHEAEFEKCNLNNGLTLSKNFEERGHLYQGYWQVEYMITELRNHTEHWKKSDSKKFLRQQLNRTVEDPISGIESPGNIFILVSVLFLISYHFIDVMQTWIDTYKLIK